LFYINLSSSATGNRPFNSCVNASVALFVTSASGQPCLLPAREMITACRLCLPPLRVRGATRQVPAISLDPRHRAHRRHGVCYPSIYPFSQVATHAPYVQCCPSIHSFNLSLLDLFFSLLLYTDRHKQRKVRTNILIKSSVMMFLGYLSRYIRSSLISAVNFYYVINKLIILISNLYYFSTDLSFILIIRSR
jgi:hypothetical protein